MTACQCRFTRFIDKYKVKIRTPNPSIQPDSKLQTGKMGIEYQGLALKAKPIVEGGEVPSSCLLLNKFFQIC